MDPGAGRQARGEYEPYGKLLNAPLESGPGYTGHDTDPDTQYVSMQQRYYDPRVGRFWSVDPVTVDSAGGNFNRYWYANNNPYRYIDPDGRFGCTGTLIKSNCGGSGEVLGGMRSVGPIESIDPQAGNTFASSSRSHVDSDRPSESLNDGSILIPGVIGWKTGKHDMWVSEEGLDSAGMVLTGAAVTGVGAIAIEAASPGAAFVAARGGRYFFGKGGLLNRGPNLRIGLGRDGGNSVFRIGGKWLERIPEPMRRALGIKEIKPGEYKWDLWQRGDL